MDGDTDTFQSVGAAAQRALDYLVWRTRLAGGKIELPNREAQCGFWRVQGRDGTWTPVAIWRDEGVLRCLMGTKAIVPNDYWCENTFSYASRNPISHDTYQRVMDGEPWPDVDAVVHAGRNATPEDDAEAIKDQIAAAIAQAVQYETVTDDETAARAQSLRSRILELAGEVKERHKTEKAPHLETCRTIDAKWLTLVKAADVAATAIRRALSKHETYKANNEPVTVLNPNAAPPEQPRQQIRGGYGRAASVRDVRRAVIQNQDEVYQAFREHGDVRDVLQSLAQKAVDSGRSIQGVTVVNEKRVA
jgi:hypothetical protein